MEYGTRDRIRAVLEPLEPDQVVELGETGIAFIFSGNRPGKTVLFRAELDALPILEEGRIAHRSKVDGVGHLCGHDGHMAILVGLAERIASLRPETGRAVLLFQPAEETGQGAREVLDSPGFQKIVPDYVFALHNIPGEPLHQVIVRRGSFCAASRGLTVILKGKTAHAAHPDEAISPANAIASLIREINVLNRSEDTFEETAFATIIHIRLGEIAFGTTPGYAEVRLTLRSFNDQDMMRLCRIVEGLVHTISRREKLKLEYQYSEIFPSVFNDDLAVGLIEDAARENGLSLRHREEPFRWSEDLGFFSQNYKCGFFGLGAGIKHAALHHPDYDFPDELIRTGVGLFNAIYQKMLR
jgi:amidohydrolase